MVAMVALFKLLTHRYLITPHAWTLTFHEAMNIWELKRVIAQQMEYYNSRRRHSTLGNTAPMDYIIQEEILPELALGLAVPST